MRPSAESPSRTAAPSATPSTTACTTMPAMADLLFALWSPPVLARTFSSAPPSWGEAAPLPPPGTAAPWLWLCMPPLMRSAAGHRGGAREGTGAGVAGMSG